MLTSWLFLAATLFSVDLHLKTYVNNPLYPCPCFLLSYPSPCLCNCSSQGTIGFHIAISNGHCSFILLPDFSAVSDHSSQLPSWNMLFLAFHDDVLFWSPLTHLMIFFHFLCWLFLFSGFRNISVHLRSISGSLLSSLWTLLLSNLIVPWLWLEFIY